MKYFSEQQIAELQNDYDSIEEKYLFLLKEFTSHKYKTEDASEHATQGFMRRLKTMSYCIRNVFELLPPDLDVIPSEEDRDDALINIQAFLFNVFGSVDNLAWMWVKETNLKKNGKEPSKNQIGLRSGNKIVRESLPKNLEDHLKGLEAWFEYLENFRHALAHRVPPYIPPHIVPPDKEAAYLQLEEAINAAINVGDIEKHDRLRHEQEALAFFRPWILHSFIEKTKPIVFHAQLLVDFKTVFELGRLFIEELGQQKHRN